MIKVDKLFFTYPGRKEPTLKGMDFTIKKGEIFGFLGPSGAGKSTAQKILIGMLKNYQGGVRIFDQEVSQVRRSYYERIGVAFEFPNFYQRLTAMENLSLFRNLYAGDTAEPTQLLTEMGLMESAHMKVTAYSKGMKMRLNLCRALLNHPDILFLDEPTSGLDPLNAKKVKDKIICLKEEGKTILITTHNMSTADEICDRVAFIVDGKIELIDSPRNLRVLHNKRKVRLEYREMDHQLVTSEFDLQGIGTNHDFLGILQTRNVETIHTQEATLEDIFINVTGRGLK
ncbi:ABC transporter ATP-binding protein [Oceanobacillus picturae]|uniref:ABC transporter ATP-binding protein n=1 Tax=Oceanobacillus picturae TaxID=171693 RepID=UPI000E68BE1D|nr:ABC transporter ATP-binding protein [Oceanobacillus picturae]RIU93284.1 ABC transporter ATP-binding protein [Oceanobacillus picturae]